MAISYRITFDVADHPLVGAVTKFGGWPSWLQDPAEPRSSATGEPMTFVGQLVIPKHLYRDDDIRMAYVFMSQSGFGELFTWDPRYGETAVIVQRGTSPPKVATPWPGLLTSWSALEDGNAQFPCEYLARLSFLDEPEGNIHEGLQLPGEAKATNWVQCLRGNKIGGDPYWRREARYPAGCTTLLLQLEDDTFPFALNLGKGCGYVFINDRCTAGALMWQR